MADLRHKRIAELIEPLRVTPGRRVTLAKHFDPGYKAGFLDKQQGEELLAHGIELLSEYQERWRRRTPTASSWCSCRRSTPPARTAPSATS